MAVDVLREMERRNHKIANSSCRFMILELCRNEKLDVSIQVLEIMICNQIKPNAIVYISLIRGLAASGMIGEAHALSSKKNYPETPKKHGEDNRN